MMTINTIKHLGVFAVIALLTSICTATTITQTYGVFDVTFYNAGDTNGKYTGESDWTSQQMADVATSINEWQSCITNTPGRNIQIHMFWNQLNVAGGKSLGGSINQRMQADGHLWNSTEYVWRTGQQVITNNYGYDTAIRLDTTAAGTSWNFGSDTPTSGEVDFRSVLTHELGHSLGWDTSYDRYYDDWGWMYTSGSAGKYFGVTTWDENLVDSTGNKPINGQTGTPGNFNQTDNPVYFDGVNAVAVYGDIVPVYAPATYSLASSLIHLDEATFGSSLMSSSIGLGQTARTISELEWAMMEDMGWNIVPEPSSILLMVWAVGLIRLKRK
jgi:hypothetical protein